MFILVEIPPIALWKIADFQPDEGVGYLVALPAGFPPGDTPDAPYNSEIELLENGKRLGPSHTMHADIRAIGTGRFSHWANMLYLSTSDNSDPRSNGRDYHVYVPTDERSSSPRRRAQQILRALPDAYTPDAAYGAVEAILACLYPDAKVGEDQKSFWGDDQFLESFRRFCGENYRSLERKYTVASLLGALDRVDGDLAECGVYNGGTAYFIARANQQFGRRRQLHLFDSFAGLSAPATIDGIHWHRGDLAISERDTRAKLDEFDCCRFYRGWIPERFSEVGDRRFCFVHVDVDLHQPTLDSIAFFYPRLNAGGILVCDDYGFDSCPGARAAMDQYFADKPDRIIHLPTGQGVVIKLVG